jgi:hypothetical protein
MEGGKKEYSQNLKNKKNAISNLPMAFFYEQNF